MRAAGRAARSALSDAARMKKSEQIAQRLYALPEYVATDAVAVYVSIGDEVATHDIIEHALADGKRVFCPKVLDAVRMEFYEIRALSGLKPSGGKPSIPEPDGRSMALSAYTGRVLMLVPGVAFSTDGARIGYGGGYYDRYLQGKNITVIGFAFACHVFSETFPVTEHDVLIPTVLTET